ncbi:glycosyl transferase family 2, partial [Escherichia coli]|nr:glycosyl transferase family 2 [Escherichia coli]
MSNDEHSLEACWQPLLRADKWLACYPSLCYQRPGFSDTEKKTTDNIAHYFNKLPVVTKPSTLPIADTIGFFMETSFHYTLYRPIITALQAQGQSCTLVINDRVFK